MRTMTILAAVMAVLGVAFADTLDDVPVVCESAATVEGREPSLLPKCRTFKLQTGQLAWDIPHNQTQFHVFGLLWEPDGYTVFIDGKQRGPKLGNGGRESVSQTEEFILISTEAKWFRNNRMTGKGVPELEEAVAAGDEFLVDYVRVYDIAE